MGLLRDRVNRKHERESYWAAQTKAAQDYTEMVKGLYNHDAVYGDNALERLIQAQFGRYAEVMEQLEPQPEGKEIPATKPEEKTKPKQKGAGKGKCLVSVRSSTELRDSIAFVLNYIAPHIPDPNENYTDWWRVEALRDRRSNILWALYVTELTQVHPEALEYEEYSEVICARAVLRLLAYTPRGEELLRSLYSEHEQHLIPNRDTVVRALKSDLMSETDTQEFLARLFYEVPRSRKAVYRLLAGYKEIIRIQVDRDDKPSYDGELPDDEIKEVAVPVTVDYVARLLGLDEFMPGLLSEEEIRFERAVLSVIRGERSYRDASQHFNVTKSRLQKEVKNRKEKAAERLQKVAG